MHPDVLPTEIHVCARNHVRGPLELWPSIGAAPLSSEHTSPPVWDAKHMRIAIEAAGVALWSWNVDSDKITMDKRGFNLWGVPRQGSVTFADLSANIHPQDLDRVRRLSPRRALLWAPTKSIFALYSTTMSDGFPLGAKATIQACSTGSCSGFSLT
jgi:hypothetical protein